MAFVHTHGVYKYFKGQDAHTVRRLNYNFSKDDEKWAKKAGVFMYLATTNGMLKRYDPTKEYGRTTKKILNEWKLPHDKNDPTLPEDHGDDCEDCHVINE